MGLFRYLTPATYALLILVWGYIFLFCVARLIRRSRDRQLLYTLLLVLALAALGTTIESAFFGLRYAAVMGILPETLHEPIERPEFVLLPKAFNLLTGLLIIALILRRWLPQDEAERTSLIERERTLESLVEERTKALEETNRALAKDLEERSHLERALRESDDRFKAIFECGSVGIVVFSPDFELLECNDALLSMLGYSFDELCEVGIKGVSHSQDYRVDLALATEVLEGKRDSYQIEKRYIRKDGDTIWGNLTVAVIRDDQGQPRLGIGMVADITERKKAQEAVRANEEQFRSLVQNASDVITVHWEDGEIFYESPSASRILGYGPNGLLGKTPKDFIHPDDLREVTGAMQEVIEGRNKGIPTVFRFRHAMGHWLYVEALGQNLLDHPSIHGIVITSRDITERMRAEEALRNSESMLRAFYDSAPFRMGVVELLDSNIRFVTVNAGFAESYGLPLDAVEGHTAAELGVPQDEVDEWVDHYREAIATHRPVHFEITHSRGEPATLLEANVAPLESSPGALPRLLFVVEDVTERRKAEAELSRQRALLETILRQAGDAILVCDREGKVLFANAAARRIARVPDDTAIISTSPSIWGTAYTPEGVEVPQDQWSVPSALRGEVYLSKEVHMVRPDRTSYDILISSAPARNMKGEIIAAVATFTEITHFKKAEEERRKLEAQVQHAQKLESLGVLAGGIAHDFNNLLVGILGNAELALAELSPHSPARSYLHDVAKAAQRASELSKQMLAYSGKGKFIVEPINLNEVIKEMTHLLEASISKNATLRLYLEESLPFIEADATQTRQVVMNLITNASDALEGRMGTVSISTGLMYCDRAYFEADFIIENLDEGEYVYLEVSDTGCGMDAETAKRIFDPFFTTKFTGRGLGLAAVLGIVRGHQGTLKVYSEPGQGTVFKILFPVSTSSPTYSSTSFGEADSLGLAGTILLVDDEEIVRRVAKRMLERLGFDVITAPDGQQAVDLYQRLSQNILCVLLDLTMPRKDGEATFTELRGIRHDAQVILISGYNEQEIKERFAGRGFAGFLQKPFRMEDLHAILSRVNA